MDDDSLSLENSQADSNTIDKDSYIEPSKLTVPRMNLFNDAGREVVSHSQIFNQQINEGSDCPVLNPKANFSPAKLKRKTLLLFQEDVDESVDSPKRVPMDLMNSGDGLINQQSDLMSRVTDAISEYSGVFVDKNANFNQIVPKEHREKFRMIYRSSLGDKEERKVTNSDIVYFDHYFFELQDHTYSQEAQETFYKEKNHAVSRLQLTPN